MSSAESGGRAPGRGRLRNRRILVVGAGTRASDDPESPIGNGRAIALLAAREGAAVGCADLDAAAAGATLKLVEAEGATGIAITADVADPVQCSALVARAHAGLGGLDGLVLNVGIGAGAGLAGTSVEQWDAAFAVNVRAHFLICKEALPLMEPGGSIILISSVAGLKPGTGVPSYDASKAALFGLCRHVAREGAGRGIRANTVVPGLIDTPMGRAAGAARPGRDRAGRVPMRRQGTAWEIAYATVFLLSGEADYITGQALAVDGGLSTLV